MMPVWSSMSAQVVFSPSLYLIFIVFQSQEGDFSSLKLESPDVGNSVWCVCVCVCVCVFVWVGDCVLSDFMHVNACFL